MARVLPALALLGGCLVTYGCGPSSFWPRHFQDTLAGSKAFSETPLPPRDLPMFDGRGGLVLDWADLMEAIRQADVVVVGETHTDAAGHKVELAIVQDVLERWAGSAVSMEMLVREDQPAADEYVAGKIDEAEFVKRTHTADWAGKGTWQKWYHPITATARVAGGRLVAANAPRKYADLARKQGYDALEQLPEAERKLFDIPQWATRGGYYRRFREAMKEHVPPPKPEAKSKAEEKPKREEKAKPDEKAKTAGKPPGKPEQKKEPHRPLTGADIKAMFRSQQLWDATMAGSILRAAAQAGTPKVVHLAGGFHSEFDGGLIQRIRRGNPDLTLLTISLQPLHSRRLRSEDRGRADVVVYTGGN